VLCVLALAACAAEDEGEGENNIGMGANGGTGGGVSAVSGGAGGVAGMMLPAGMGGSAGAAGMTMVGSGGVGGVVSTGGVGGMMATGGVGGEAGMTATGGVGGMMTGEGGGGPIEWEDKGMGDGSDVITIGDSYMNYGANGGIEISLEDISGRDYRNYGVAGTMVLNDQIPNQYRAAINENPNVKTVVMTGGGNDILLGNVFCTIAWSESCTQTVRDVADALAELRAEMAADGVEDVVLVGYGTPTDLPAAMPGLVLGRELSVAMCVPGAMPRCHWIDPAVELVGNISGDGIHPTQAGYDILGQLTWDLIQDRKLRR
jgi:hypothetical protein